MEVEEGKKENRSLGTFSFKLKEFISKYKKKDIYMVESLPKPMRGNISSIVMNKVCNSDHPTQVRFTHKFASCI